MPFGITWSLETRSGHRARISAFDCSLTVITAAHFPGPAASGDPYTNLAASPRYPPAPAMAWHRATSPLWEAAATTANAFPDNATGRRVT